MNKLSIKQIPLEDRPYEKFERLGAKYLTDAELLAIIIKNGSKSFNSLDIARYILGNHENGFVGFKYLNQASLAELMGIKGIGKVKAIQLKAVLELANRNLLPPSIKLGVINSSNSIFEFKNPLFVFSKLINSIFFIALLYHKKA